MRGGRGFEGRGVSVRVRVRVGVRVAVRVGVSARVKVAVRVSARVRVAVRVGVRVRVGLRVGVRVRVGLRVRVSFMVLKNTILWDTHQSLTRWRDSSVSGMWNLHTGTS